MGAVSYFAGLFILKGKLGPMKKQISVSTRSGTSGLVQGLVLEVK